MLNTPTELLALHGLRLAWSDGDPHSRGTVLDPAELVGEHVRFLPGDHDAERLDLGLTHLPRFWDGDFFGVGYQCAGNVRGEAITAADVAHLVRALLGLTEVWPAWARPVAHGAVFLLVDSEPKCLRHGNREHREAWVCRVWLDVERTAVDLSRVDWAEVERERARMELAARQDEQRALAAREATRAAMQPRRHRPEVITINGSRCVWCDQPGDLAKCGGVMACEVCRGARREIGGA